MKKQKRGGAEKIETRKLTKTEIRTGKVVIIDKPGFKVTNHFSLEERIKCEQERLLAEGKSTSKTLVKLLKENEEVERRVDEICRRHSFPHLIRKNLQQKGETIQPYAAKS